MAADLAVPATVGYPARRPFWLLAGWFVLGALQLLLVVWRPPHPDTNIAVCYFVMGLSMLMALVTVTAGPRLGLPFHIGLVAVAIAIPLGITLVSVAGQGQMMCGFFLVIMSVYIGYFMPRFAVLPLLAFMVIGFGLTLAVVPLLDSMTYGVVIECILVAVTLVVANLADHLRNLAMLDPLTGILNRRGLEPAASHVHDLADRLHQPTVVVEIDLDGFKAYNDQHGHPAGDALLVSTVGSWLGELRRSDVIARTGGDEFVIVLPNTTANAAEDLLTRLRSVSPTQWTAGVTVWEPDERLSGAILHADSDLYAHKPQAR